MQPPQGLCDLPPPPRTVRWPQQNLRSSNSTSRTWSGPSAACRALRALPTPRPGSWGSSKAPHCGSSTLPFALPQSLEKPQVHVSVRDDLVSVLWLC